MNYKLPITKDGKETLMKVIQWLEGNTQRVRGIDGFSMRSGIEHYTQDWTGDICGTVCCIAGAIAIFSGSLIADDKNVWSWQCVKNAALECMGWKDLYYSERNAEKTIDTLFFGASRFEDQLEFFACVRDRRPLEAACTLQHLIESGEVQWVSEEQQPHDARRYNEFSGGNDGVH